MFGIAGDSLFAGYDADDRDHEKPKMSNADMLARKFSTK